MGDHGVTESNMIQYLGIIEQRTIEILKMYENADNPEPPDLKDKVSTGEPKIAKTKKYSLQAPEIFEANQVNKILDKSPKEERTEDEEVYVVKVKDFKQKAQKLIEIGYDQNEDIAPIKTRAQDPPLGWARPRY